MSKKRSPAAYIPDIFDNSPRAKLFRMGLLTPAGEVDAAMMRAFSCIFAGQFLEDLCDHHASLEQIMEVAEAFAELASQDDDHHIYLMLSIQYDRMRKTLPDPIWSLINHDPARKLFCSNFVERFLELLNSTADVSETQGGPS
jgi:hypothetical protein